MYRNNLIILGEIDRLHLLHELIFQTQTEAIMAMLITFKRITIEDHQHHHGEYIASKRMKKRLMMLLDHAYCHGVHLS